MVAVPPSETVRLRIPEKALKSGVVRTMESPPAGSPGRSGGQLANGVAHHHLFPAGRCCRLRRQQRPAGKPSGRPVSCSWLTMAPAGQAGRWPFLAASLSRTVSSGSLVFPAEAGTPTGCHSHLARITHLRRVGQGRVDRWWVGTSRNRADFQPAAWKNAGIRDR